MPTVPYNPVPTVSPETPGEPYLTTTGATPEAFGVGIGRSVQRLGAATEKAGDTAFNDFMYLQNLKAQSDAKDSVMRFAVKAGDTVSKFYTYEGADAEKNKPQFDADIQQLRQDSLQGLAPMARRLADQEITRRAEFALIDAGRHTAQQTKVYANETSQGRVALAEADSGNDPYNDERFKHNTDVRHAELGANARTKGYELDEKGGMNPRLQREIDVSDAKAWQNRLKSIAERDPSTALKMYNEHKEDIRDRDITLAVERNLLQQGSTVGAQNIVHQVTSGSDYKKATIGQESAGDPFAKAPTSSARGLYQFLDPTWKDLRRKHPELGLPETVAGATPEQEEAAFETFTSENRAALRAAGIDPNDKNTHMAHFLGAGGATKFIKGMEQNPDQPAAGLVGEAEAKANRSVFFDANGQPRSAQEVYNHQTAKFGGPGEPLTGKSTGQWLEQARSQGRAMADALMPGDPFLADKVDTGIVTQWNRAHAAARAEDQGNFNEVYSFVIGGGDTSKRVTDLNNITMNDHMNDLFNKLPPLMQQRIINRVTANSKQDTIETTEEREQYQQVMGKSVTNEEEFLNADTSHLSRRHQDAIFNKQLSIQQHNVNKNQINGVLGDAVVKSMLRSVGLGQTKDDVQANNDYAQIVGAINERLEAHMQQHNNVPMTPTEYRKAVAEEIGTVYSSWLFGTRRSFQVPKDFKDSWRERLTQKLGHEPSEAEWGSWHRHYMEEKLRASTTQ